MLPTVTPRADNTTEPRERGANSPHRLMTAIRAAWPSRASIGAPSFVSSFGSLTVRRHRLVPPVSGRAALARPLTSQFEGSAREVVSTAGHIDAPNK